MWSLPLLPNHIKLWRPKYVMYMKKEGRNDSCRTENAVLSIIKTITNNRESDRFHGGKVGI